MSRPRSLRGRLALSYLGVVAAVVVASAITSWLLTPTLFAQRIRAGVGMGSSRGAGPGGPMERVITVPAQVQDAYSQALTIALVVSAAAGLLIAVGLAAWLSRRTLRNLRQMEHATGRLAGGDYRHPIGVPDEIELAGLAGSINALGTQLAATEQARARLVSDLAHELRNPLATIEGYMEGLIDGVLPANADTYSTVATEAHRLQRLTRDLSLLSRAQEGRLELNLGRVDLGELVCGVTERLRPQFDVKGVALGQDVQGVLEVVGDADRLTQTLTNVLGNALMHTPPDGSVTVAGRRRGDLVRVTVTDTGEGIPPDRLGDIFERFTRLAPDAPGTGIGLNIARTIARLHRGDLTAYSEGPGTGSRFTLELPAADAATV